MWYAAMAAEACKRQATHYRDLSNRLSRLANETYWTGFNMVQTDDKQIDEFKEATS